MYRVVEDGSNTQFRLSVIESLLPPRTAGPVFHFHEMHDEGFYVTVRASQRSYRKFNNANYHFCTDQKGMVRFHSPGRPDIDVKAGEMVTIPIRLPHKFSNPFDEEAIFLNTATPGFFVRYFEHLERLIGEGKELTEKVNREALLRFATIPLGKEEVEKLESSTAT